MSHLWRSLAEAVQASHTHAPLLADNPAEQRLASFLVRLSERNQAVGLAGDEPELSIRRVDIANFLGMTTETVSRWLTRLQRLRAIVVEGRQVTICDCLKLRSLAVGTEPRRVIGDGHDRDQYPGRIGMHTVGLA